MRARNAIRLPVRRHDWRLVWTVVARVFSSPGYLVVALAVGGITLTAMAIARNLELVVQVVLQGQLPPMNRLRVLLELYPFVGTGFELWTGLAVVTLSLLIGVNAAMLAYHVLEHGATLAAGAGGSLAATGGLLGGLGAGCALCGASLLVGAFSLVGGTAGALLESVGGPLAILLSFSLVFLSIFWIAEGMHGGLRRREVAASRAEQ